MSSQELITIAIKIFKEIIKGGSNGCKIEFKKDKIYKMSKIHNKKTKKINNLKYHNIFIDNIKVFKFINPMITTDNIFGTYIYLATGIAALCSCVYFENLYYSFAATNKLNCIGAFVLYPVISYVA